MKDKSGIDPEADSLVGGSYGIGGTGYKPLPPHYIMGVHHLGVHLRSTGTFGLHNSNLKKQPRGHSGQLDMMKCQPVTVCVCQTVTESVFVHLWCVFRSMHSDKYRRQCGMMSTCQLMHVLYQDLYIGCHVCPACLLFRLFSADIKSHTGNISTCANCELTLNTTCCFCLFVLDFDQ